MAKSKTKRSTTSRQRSAGTAAAKRPQDAIAALKADHRQVEEWFAQFEKTNSAARKQDLATRICQALKVHTTLEEELFYPAFLEATEDKDIHHEAEVEHDGAKKLIAEIEAAGPSDEYFDARVSVLSEMIKHHVKEEEQRGGMFSKARESDMDLVALGEQLQRRKEEVMAEQPPGRSQESGGRKRRGGVAGALMGRNGAGAEGSTRRT